ncbi:MAG: RNA polymerase sigma factor [bacterium]
MQKNLIALKGLSDEELIARTKEGDPEPLGVLFERHRKRLRNAIYVILRDHRKILLDIDDLMQDTFLKAYHAITKGKIQPGNFPAWLQKVGHNLTVDVLRRRAWRDLSVPFPEDDDEESMSLHFEPGADETMIKAETVTLMQKFLGELNPKSREVILLHFYADRPFTEIGSIIRRCTRVALRRKRSGIADLRRKMGVPEMQLGKAS